MTRARSRQSRVGQAQLPNRSFTLCCAQTFVGVREARALDRDAQLGRVEQEE